MVTFDFDERDEDAEYTDYREFEDHFDAAWDEEFDTNDFIVQTSGHGWQNKSGEFEKTYHNGHEAIDDIVEGLPQWSMEARIEDGACFITLYSHDNPTGAGFEIYPQ